MYSTLFYNTDPKKYARHKKRPNKTILLCNRPISLHFVNYIIFKEKVNEKYLNKKSDIIRHRFFCCDSGGIQTLDLQNRNLTLYSLSYQAKDGAKVNIISEESKCIEDEFSYSFFFLPKNITSDILQLSLADILPFCK